MWSPTTASISTAGAPSGAPRIGSVIAWMWACGFTGGSDVALVHQDPPLVRPVHALLEVRTRPEPLEHEQAAQEVLVQQGDVRRVDVELGREGQQVWGVGMEAGRSVDEPR